MSQCCGGSNTLRDHINLEVKNILSHFFVSVKQKGGKNLGNKFSKGLGVKKFFQRLLTPSVFNKCLRQQILSMFIFV